MNARAKAIVAGIGVLAAGIIVGVLTVDAQSPAKPDPPKSSYISVNEEDFRTVLARMKAAKAGVQKRQADL